MIHMGTQDSQSGIHCSREILILFLSKDKHYENLNLHDKLVVPWKTLIKVIFLQLLFTRENLDDSPKDDQSDILPSDVGRVLPNRKKMLHREGFKKTWTLFPSRQTSASFSKQYKVCIWFLLISSCLHLGAPCLSRSLFKTYDG